VITNALPLANQIASMVEALCKLVAREGRRLHMPRPLIVLAWNRVARLGVRRRRLMGSASRLGKNAASPTRRGICTIRAMPSSFYKTGTHRQQVQPPPARIEDYVGRNNAVRAIEAYVGSLDLAKLKFGHAAREVGAGQPPYDPADLLKLYLYGYLNQIRSSRRLQREAGRNVELMWLRAA
jgi:hypothetical protein